MTQPSDASVTAQQESSDAREDASGVMVHTCSSTPARPRKRGSAPAKQERFRTDRELRRYGHTINWAAADAFLACRILPVSRSTYPQSVPGTLNASRPRGIAPRPRTVMSLSCTPAPSNLSGPPAGSSNTSYMPPVRGARVLRHATRRPHPLRTDRSMKYVLMSTPWARCFS